MTVPQGYTMLDWALRYAEHFHLLPIHTARRDGSCSCGDSTCRNVGKHPRTPSGVRDATCDPNQVRAWWEKFPDANIGLACGASGIVGLDFDNYKPEFAGHELLSRLQAGYATRQVVTGAGGLHLLYGQPDGTPLSDSRGALPCGVDIKSKGYLVLPPSLHRTGKRYEWDDSDRPIAPLPDFVRELLHPTARHATHVNGLGFCDAGTTRDGDIGKARAWLARLADWRRDDYAAWISVGMALSELGEAGKQLWDEWSHPSAKYEAGVCAAKWGSFDVGDGLTLGSLKHWADEDDSISIPRVSSPLLVNDTEEWSDDQDGFTLDANPLAVACKSNLDLGWIDDYADLMSSLTASPPEFNRLAGLVVAATAIQRNARLRMTFGDIYANIYGAIISESSVYHKTSSQSKARSTLQRASLTKLLLAELMTSEGLLKELHSQSAGLVLRDEIATLFGSHNIKYLATLKRDLTALYDGTPYSRRLANDNIKVEAPYLNILGATTPARFFDSVTFNDWQDGFLPRWLLVVPKLPPDFDAPSGLYSSDQDAKFAELAAKLTNLDRHRQTDFLLTDGAFLLWDQWRRRAAKDAYLFGDDVVAAIVARNATYGLKFGIILAAVNDSWGTITEATMQTAIDLADSYKVTFFKLLSQRENYGVSGSKLQQVLRAVGERSGLDGATVRDVCRACHMKKGQVVPVIEKLVEIGAVIVLEGGNTKRYVKAVESLPAREWK